MGEGQPAAAAGAGSPLRAVTECSRLSREEISTMARIAPATAKPAPTRNAWSNPLVRATEALWDSRVEEALGAAVGDRRQDR